MATVIDWLYLASLSIGFVLTGLAATVSVALLVAPGRMQQTMRASNERYSLRKALKPLEIPRDADRLIYRHHRIAGAVLTLASSFFLYAYLTESPQLRISTWMSQQIGTDAFEATLFGLGGFLAICNFVALALGVVLFVRPSTLKPLERIANRWFSTRRATRSLDKEYGQLDSLVLRSPRIAGVLLLLGSIFILASLLLILLDTAS